jgi:hypothetical protein
LPRWWGWRSSHRARTRRGEGGEKPKPDHPRPGITLAAVSDTMLTTSLLDLPAARKLIRRAARRASVVVVAIHAGAEGTSAST